MCVNNSFRPSVGAPCLSMFSPPTPLAPLSCDCCVCEGTRRETVSGPRHASHPSERFFCNRGFISRVWFSYGSIPKKVTFSYYLFRLFQFQLLYVKVRGSACSSKACVDGSVPRHLHCCPQAPFPLHFNFLIFTYLNWLFACSGPDPNWVKILDQDPEFECQNEP